MGPLLRLIAVFALRLAILKRMRGAQALKLLFQLLG
jgi:hypothetical protein